MVEETSIELGESVLKEDSTLRLVADPMVPLETNLDTAGRTHTEDMDTNHFAA